MRVLITGANGLLGQKLTKSLLDQGVHVIATSRGKNKSTFLQPNYHYFPLDITSKVDIKNAFQIFQPEVVIHTAAMTNVDQCELNQEACWETNVTAVDHLSKAAKDINAYFLLLSTDFIFDGVNGPYHEEDTPNPINFYGKSKLVAEELIQKNTSSWGIARAILVYGIANGLSRSNIILWTKESLEKGQKIQVVDDQWRTPILAEDLSTACIQMAKLKKQGIFHIGGPDTLTPYQMAIKTAQFFHLDQDLIIKANAKTFQQPALRPHRTGFLIEKAVKELNFSPHSFDEGIRYLANELQKTNS